MMHIGIDIDHVLLHGCEEDFLKFMIEKGWPFDPDTFARTHNYNLAIPRTTAQTNAAFAEYLRSGRGSHLINAIPGAHTAMAVLRKHFQIQLITGRTPIVDAYTRYDLARHLPGLNLHNIFTSGHLGTKHIPLKEHNVTCHIDDSAHEITSLLQWWNTSENSTQTLYIIQFPRLNSQPIQVFSDPRVLRLPSCDIAHQATTPEAQVDLYEQAWQEVLWLIATLDS